MKKSFKLFLAMLLIGGFAISFSSCSDKDVSEAEVIDPSDPYGKTTEDAEDLLSILYATADIDSLPNDWKKSNYKEEPTIGKVLDEANPYVRSTGAVSAEEAISFFNSITSSSVQKSATSASWSKEGIGSINLNVINKDGVYATIDVHIQQLPHLTQIRFIDKSLLGENANNQPAYYHIGDVVSTVEDGQTIYWVCVRNCNKSFGKGKSHWVSFQLADKNYKTYAKDPQKNRAQLVVPYKLSSSKSVTDDIENAVKLFVALSNPEKYDEIDAFEKGLGLFGKVTYPTSMIRKIASQWQQKNIKKKLLPAQVIKDNLFSYFNMKINANKVPFFYYGHERSSGNVTLYRTLVSMNGDDSFETENSNVTWKWDTKSFNIKTYVNNGTRISDGINADNPLERTGAVGLVIRCKTGKELCGKGSGNIFSYADDPDYTQPFPADAPTQVTEVFRYDENATEPFIAGDLAEDAEGSLWTCIASPCSSNDKTIFITTDNIKYSADKKVVTNNDLPTINQAYIVFTILNGLYQYQTDPQFIPMVDWLNDSSKGAFPLSQYIQARSYKGDVTLTGNNTTFAVRSGSTSSAKQQQLLRLYLDNSNRDFGTMLKGYTQYQDTKLNMYLDDVSDMDIVDRFIKTDTINKNFWLEGRKAPTYRTKAGHGTVDSYLYYRDGAIVNGNPIKKGGFADPEDFYSIFMEPVAIFRVRIVGPGEEFGLVKKGVNILNYEDDIYEPNDYNVHLSKTLFDVKDNIYRNDAIFLNGKTYSFSYVGQ